MWSCACFLFLLAWAAVIDIIFEGKLCSSSTQQIFDMKHSSSYGAAWGWLLTLEQAIFMHSCWCYKNTSKWHQDSDSDCFYRAGRMQREIWCLLLLVVLLR
jgi:hypothetical protein